MNSNDKDPRKLIRVFITDVDGTLTDGMLYFSGDGEIMKAFNVQDGYGLAKLLPAAGIIPVILTGRNSKIVERRCEDLKIKHVYQGVSNKLNELADILERISCELGEEIGMENCAFVGDDLPDLECIKSCGIGACPANAVPAVLAVSDIVAKSKAGDGAVRELIDWLLEGK